MTFSTLRENIQNQTGTIYDTTSQRHRKVSLLYRRKFMVEYHHRSMCLRQNLADFLYLAFTDESGRIRLLPCPFNYSNYRKPVAASKFPQFFQTFLIPFTKIDIY